MKQLWRDIRGVLRGVAVQAVARLVAGLLALLGAATAVAPEPVAGSVVQVQHAVGLRP